MSHIHLKNLASHKILILGYGANHHAMVGYLLSKGCELTIRDANPVKEAEFQAMYPDPEATVHWQIQPDILKDLDGFDVIFRTPSIAFDHPSLEKARKKGALVTTQTNLFMELCPAPVVGITGTKGKGTTSTLISRILEAGYSGGKVYLGGNIGIDPCSFLDQLTSHDVVVLELSSFQLEDLAISPHIAIVLHVTVDHLDRHPTLASYREAKLGILKHQKATDIAIINSDYSDMQYYLSHAKGKVLHYYRHTAGRQAAWVDTQEDKEVVFYQLEDQLDSFELKSRKLLGDHNLENILPAVLVGAIYEVPGSVMAQVISEFKGLEHRLSHVENSAGIEVYDDSFSTAPEACAVALSAMPANKRIHLIVGGRDKGQNYVSLAETIVKRCTTAVLIPGKTTDQIEKDVKQAQKKLKNTSFTMVRADGPTPVECMENALQKLAPNLMEGDVVLLSPGAASGPPFKDYKERGNAFVTAVAGLKKEEA